MAIRDTNSEANEPLRVRSLATSALTVLALVVLLRYADGFFIPVVLAVLIAFAFNSLMTHRSTKSSRRRTRSKRQRQKQRIRRPAGSDESTDRATGFSGERYYPDRLTRAARHYDRCGARHERRLTKVSRRWLKSWILELATSLLITNRLDYTL